MITYKQNKVMFPYSLTLIIISGIFLIGTDELIISPLLPELVDDLDTTFSLASLTVSLYGLAIGLAVPFIAPVIDRIPRSRLMGFSLLGFSISSLLCAFSPTISLLLVSRFFSGMFAGVYIPAAYSFVGDNVPAVQRGRVMGIVLSGWSLSLIAGVPIGAFIGELMHWRWTFILIGMSGVFVSLLTIFFLPKERNKIVVQSSKGQFFTHLWYAMKQKQVSVIIVATFCNMFGFYGLYTFLGSYIQEAYSLSAGQSGRVILFYGLGIALSPLIGIMVDFIGTKRSLVLSLLGLSGCLILLSNIEMTIIILYLMLVTWGTLQSMALTSISSLLSEQSDEYRGRIMSLYSLATNTAVALGSYAMGFVYHQYNFGIIGLICGVLTGIGALVLIGGLMKSPLKNIYIGKVS